MRRKKHKAARRIVRYYKLHFGFREPYKVLLDGNFIHAVTQLKYQENIESIVSNLLGGNVKLLVSACVIRELKGLAKADKQFQSAVALARKFMRHKCACPEKQTCTDCMLAQTGNNNEHHWWLASQDKEITDMMRQNTKCGIPLIYANLNGIHLLPPSDSVKNAVDMKTKEHMHVQPHELADDALADLKTHRSPASSVKFKRKRTKGPNPLSVKKSTKVQKVHVQNGDGASKKLRRKRKSGADGRADS